MIVYKTTCITNGKIYIGKDKNDNPSYIGSGTILHYAIRKYGKDKFIKETIEICSDVFQLAEREAFWIVELKSYDREIGYNIITHPQFGDVLTNNPRKEEILQKMKDLKLGPFREKKGVLNPMWGKKHSQRSRKAMSLQKIGKYVSEKNPMARKIYQYDAFGMLLNTWNCAKDCVDFYKAAKIDISRGNLSSAAKFNTLREDCELRRTKNFVFSFEPIEKKIFNAWMIRYTKKKCHE